VGEMMEEPTFAVAEEVAVTTMIPAINPLALPLGGGLFQGWLRWS
jgi:hypothetical protein